jgi:phage baseplate assembly protein W
MSDPGDFVGSGWAFPLGVGPHGGIAMATGPDEIVASLRVILGTAPGERVMRPEFGCRIWDHLFAPVEPNSLGLMVQAVREAVGRWEPRVDLESVTVRPDPGDASRVLISLAYAIRATNDRRNLVFPFYVIPKEG